MDPLEVLLVRFHFGGEFDFDDHSLNYVRGRNALSHIERDKLSLPEFRGFLGDHVNLTAQGVVDFHWLPPGADMSNGVRSLADDQSCRYMSDCIIVGEVAEVYAEIYKTVGGELVMWTSEPENYMLILGSPNKDYMMNNEDVGNSSSDDESVEGDGAGDSELEDSDYMQGDDDTSGDDEEANEFLMNARIQRKNPAAVVAISHKAYIPDVLIHESGEENGSLDEFDPPMVDSTEEASYEDDDDGEGIRRKSRFIRYDSEVVFQTFVLA